MAKQPKRARQANGKKGRREEPAVSPGLEPNQRILAAYLLGRDNHVWRLLRKLNMDETREALQIRQEIHVAIVELAPVIYPKLSIDPAEGRAVLQWTPNPSTKFESLDLGTAICSDWFHSVMNHPLKESLLLAPWFQLGSAIGECQSGTIDLPPFAGLGKLIRAAELLADNNNFPIAELKAIAAGKTTLADQGNNRFLYNVLGWDPRRYSWPSTRGIAAFRAARRIGQSYRTPATTSSGRHRSEDPQATKSVFHAQHE